MKTKTLAALVTGGMGLVFAGAALAVAGDEEPRPVAAASAQSPAATTAAPDPTAANDPTATTGPSATTDPAAPTGSAAPTNPATTGQDAFGAEQARELALRTAGGGQVMEIEREQEHGRPVWSVEILNGAVEHEIDVDRESGTVTDHEREAADDDRDDDDHDDRDDDYDDED